MLTNIYECLVITLRSWRSLCDHCELMANGIRKPNRHTFATGETSITIETPQNDCECLRTATNVWRSFAIITNSWRTAFVSPFAIYSPQCESSIKNYNKDNVEHMLKDATWSDVYSCSSVEGTWLAFKSRFQSIVDSLAPLKEIRFK